MHGITKFLVILLGVLLVLTVTLMIVAQTKNMTLIEFIKSWFETASETLPETVPETQALIKL